MSVLIENLQRKVEVNTDKLRKVAQEILSQEEVDPHLELSIALVDSETIRHLNARYRGVDEPTDVLSFPMDTDEERAGLPARLVAGPPVRLLGDVLICPEIALDQAKELKHSLDEELSYLLTHGIFSLLGKKERGKR